MAGVSPSSSPRLPSPPPIAEDQIGPKSPIAASEEHGKLFSSVDHGASRRIRPGTKAADMAEGPPLVELIEVSKMVTCTGAFQISPKLSRLKWLKDITTNSRFIDRFCFPVDGASQSSA